MKRPGPEDAALRPPPPAPPFPRARSLAEQMQLAANRPSGFDYLRLVLAIGVIAQHTINVSYGADAARAFWGSPARLLVGPILPIFFALSGFLIAGSLMRCATLISFLGLRAIRILPALMMEVLLSALILGPIFTVLPLGDYLSSGEFARYFLNMLGDVHFRLPGVFTENPLPLTVNGQLWTVPYELKCYAAIAALALVGIVWHRGSLLAAVIVAQPLLAFYGFFGHPQPSLTVPGMMLVDSFLCGLLIFIHRDRLAWNVTLFAVCMLACGILLMIPQGDYLIGLPIAYVTAFLGLTNPRRSRWLLSGDYSYGLFLYGFPIQQAIAALFPPLRHWWINLALSLPLAALVAVVSWWLIEKPAFGLKAPLTALERHMVDRLPRWISRLIAGSAMRAAPVRPAGNPASDQ